MRPPSRVLVPILAGVVVVSACTHTTRTVIVPEIQGASPVDANRGSGGGLSAAATLGVPPGQLPSEGECRIWIPGSPPGQQPRPKSRPCPGIEPLAPAGSWILYRPVDNRKLVYVRVVHAQRPGLVILTRIFDIETTRLLREETP